jgi:16S rRNA (cytidine1402-2'-O)-methyltransferase
MITPNPIGTLWLIPTLLGDAAESALSLPAGTMSVVERLDHFVVENAKSARAYIKRVAPTRVIQSIVISEFNAETPLAELQQILAPLADGRDIGVLSEAGLPCVADPGARLVMAARAMASTIRPLVGPSSIMLALMASGMNGQRFRFLGYLPVEKGARLAAIRESEKASRQFNETQIAIETPYRNESMLADLSATLDPATLVTVAVDLTLATETVSTLPARAWLGASPIGKRPAIFLWWTSRQRR